MWTAFPPSDYYEDSVTIGVSPRRPSRVPFGSGVLALLVSIDSPVKEVAMDECSPLWVTVIEQGVIALSNYLKMARRHCRRNHRSAHASCNTPR